jgi:hypothetical protein
LTAGNEQAHLHLATLPFHMTLSATGNSVLSLDTPPRTMYQPIIPSALLLQNVYHHLPLTLLWSCFLSSIPCVCTCLLTCGSLF